MLTIPNSKMIILFIFLTNLNVNAQNSIQTKVVMVQMVFFIQENKLK